ncbi:MAG: hypothetical protein HON43_05515 [Alphaproteobacteria bacterium]|nr:hypothetical protein [Alphaproteobacteria bacterium]MBT5390327.1 hypothetical protein [Alphaproteobacteria bacterium]
MCLKERNLLSLHDPAQQTRQSRLRSEKSNHNYYKFTKTAQKEFGQNQQDWKILTTRFEQNQNLSPNVAKHTASLIIQHREKYAYSPTEEQITQFVKVALYSHERAQQLDDTYGHISSHERKVIKEYIRFQESKEILRNPQILDSAELKEMQTRTQQEMHSQIKLTQEQLKEKELSRGIER